MTAYEPSTRTTKTATFATGHQVQVDKGGRYIGWALDGNRMAIWDWNTAGVLWTARGDPGVPFAHTAMMRRRVGVTDWNVSIPGQFGMLITDAADSQADVGGPAVSDHAHNNGGWIQNPRNLNDQWAVSAHYGRYPLTSGYLAPSGIVLWTINGARRLLAHTYNTSSTYQWLAFVKFSADGNYVMFTSDMNGAGRSDVFLAELPTGPVPVQSSLSPAEALPRAQPASTGQ